MKNILKSRAAVFCVLINSFFLHTAVYAQDGTTRTVDNSNFVSQSVPDNMVAGELICPICQSGFTALDNIPDTERRRLEKQQDRIKELYEWGDISREEYLRKKDTIGKELKSEDKGTKTCPDCGVKHHKECWEMIGGCSTFGCKHGPKPR